MRTIAYAACLASLLCLAVAPARGEQEKSDTAEEMSRMIPKINLTSVMVDDQEKALKFYTEVVGFVKKEDIPAGDHRWLTVVSPEDPDGTELLLEPMGLPAARVYQKAVFEAGIPLTAFAVEDIQGAYERMKKLGAVFSMAPTKAGPVTIAVFADTCGNHIQLYQK